MVVCSAALPEAASQQESVSNLDIRRYNRELILARGAGSCRDIGTSRLYGNGRRVSDS
jgi:hypothetical protein